MKIDDQLFEVKMKTMHKETLHGSFDVSSRASTTHIKPQHNRERIYVDIYANIMMLIYVNMYVTRNSQLSQYLQVLESH